MINVGLYHVSEMFGQATAIFSLLVQNENMSLFTDWPVAKKLDAYPHKKNPPAGSQDPYLQNIEYLQYRIRGQAIRNTKFQPIEK